VKLSANQKTPFAPAQSPATRPGVTPPSAGPQDSFAPGQAETLPSWQFAPKYKTSELLQDSAKAAAFQDDYLKHEAEFFAKARHPRSGLTFDGIDLDPKTGEATGVRAFSAASKECLDLGLCVKALYGDPAISKVVSPDDPSKAPEVAAEILGKKIASYNQFIKDYPGFAGYFTWFDSGEKATPVGDWAKAIPTLDLGEMMWSLMLAEKALRDTGRDDLAAAYKTYNDGLQAKSYEALYDPTQQGVRGHVEVADPQDPNSKFSGSGITTGEHGVHEGQMVVLYMTLFGGLSEEQKDKIWDGISMKKVEHEHGTTWQGFWGSPHEQWGHLFLPYSDHEGFADLTRIREKIRSHNASDRDYPGFAASAHDPIGHGYAAAAGIEGVNSQPLDFQHTYTPYGAFPMLLQFAGQLSGNVGLAWLHNMLLGPRQQGPMGAGESGDNAGTGSPPVKTIDVTFTNLLAISGGLGKETTALLKEKGKYEEFLQRMDGEYQEVFAGTTLREPAGYGLPKAPAPAVLPPYQAG
jgi:hypothetical protein